MTNLYIEIESLSTQNNNNKKSENLGLEPVQKNLTHTINKVIKIYKVYTIYDVLSEI